MGLLGVLGYGIAGELEFIDKLGRVLAKSVCLDD